MEDLLSTYDEKSDRRKEYETRVRRSQIVLGWNHRYKEESPHSHDFKEGTKYAKLRVRGWQDCNQFLNGGNVPDYEEETLTHKPPAADYSIAEIVEKVGNIDDMIERIEGD